jgi:hypothetical protein
MPYTSIDQLPAHVRKYSPKLQRMWMHVWMSTYKTTQDEGRAFASANAVLKKNMEKFGAGHYEHRDNILFLIDKFESTI